MSFHSILSRKVLASVILVLGAGLAVIQPSMAAPEAGNLLSQVNKPPEEGVPPLSSEEVRGTITRIENDSVELRLPDGEVRTYTITTADQERNQLEVGSEVVLTVRGDTVLAIGPASETRTGTTGSVQSGSSSTSSSSTTVIRRQTTVQQTQPAPAPATRPAAAQPQPVRGLW